MYICGVKKVIKSLKWVLMWVPLLLTLAVREG